MKTTDLLAALNLTALKWGRPIINPRTQLPFDEVGLSGYGVMKRSEREIENWIRYGRYSDRKKSGAVADRPNGLIATATFADLPGSAMQLACNTC